MVVDRPATDLKLADIMHTVIGLDHLLLKGERQVDRFEGGTRLVEILNRPLAEAPWIESPVAVGVIGRCRGEHKQLTVADIHDDGRPFFRLPLGDLIRQCLGGQLLQA